MTDHASGDFVYYKFTDGPECQEEIGLVLRTSSNEKADGSEDEYVELVGPLTHVLVPDAQVRKFDVEPESDPNEIVGGSASAVGGISKKPGTSGTKAGTGGK